MNHFLQEVMDRLPLCGPLIEQPGLSPAPRSMTFDTRLSAIWVEIASRDGEDGRDEGSPLYQGALRVAIDDSWSIETTVSYTHYLAWSRNMVVRSGEIPLSGLVLMEINWNDGVQYWVTPTISIVKMSDDKQLAQIRRGRFESDPTISMEWCDIRAMGIHGIQYGRVMDWSSDPDQLNRLWTEPDGRGLVRIDWGDSTSDPIPRHMARFWCGKASGGSGVTRPYTILATDPVSGLTMETVLGDGE